MPIPVVSTKCLEQIYSPFSGLPADGDNGPNESDPTLLFVYYGNAGDYAHISEKLGALIEGDIEDVDIDTLPSKLTIEGALVLEVDTGWNGVNYYGFAPVVK